MATALTASHTRHVHRDLSIYVHGLMSGPAQEIPEEEQDERLMKYEITRPLPRQMVELANGRQHR